MKRCYAGCRGECRCYPEDDEACTMGAGCDEAGVCYAAAHGEPERCPKRHAWDDLKDELSDEA